MSSKDEKALLKDIDTLKKALPEITKLTDIDPELTAIKDEKKAIRNDLDVVKQLIDEKQGKIDTVKEANQAQRNKQNVVKENAEVYTAVIDSSNEEVRDIYSTKDKMRESYYMQLLEFELQSDKMRWIKGMINQQKRLKEGVSEKESRIAKKRAEVENTPNPHSKEIDTCEHLIQYCQKLKV